MAKIEARLEANPQCKEVVNPKTGATMPCPGPELLARSQASASSSNSAPAKKAPAKKVAAKKVPAKKAPAKKAPAKKVAAPTPASSA